MESQLGIGEILSFLKRRKKLIIISLIVIFPLVVAVALWLPPIYQADTTILRESQQVSEDYIRSTETGYAEERLDAASQQVMSRSNLINIINLYNLYPELRNKKTMGEIVARMRAAIELETLYAKVTNERTGRPSAINTAFKLSYEGRDPLKVQKVTNTLASLYIELEMQTRGKRSIATTTFFENELQNLKEQIRIHEEKIRRYKEEHIGELPENHQNNIRNMDRLERELDRTENRIRTLEERRMFLQGQIATVDPLLPLKTEQGKMVVNPGERLKILRLKLMTLQSKLSDKHPDIKRLQNEIKELEEQVGKSDEAAVKVKRLRELEEAYAAQKGRLGPKHPDLIRLAKEVEILSAEVDQLLTEKIKSDVAEERPDNPTYINLKTQIFVAESEIRNLTQDKEETENQIGIYRQRIEKTPLIEKEYKELTRDYSLARTKYDDISAKLMQARVAKGVEESQFGERFVIVDPAALPENAYKPNRIAIVVLGFILAIGVGVGLAVVQEGLDHSIKSIDELNEITGNKVLSIVTMIETKEEKRNRRVKKLAWAMGTTCVIMTALVCVNTYVMPLGEVLDIIIQRIYGL